MKRVFRRDSAKRELLAIVDYLGRQSPAVAVRFLEAIETACEQLLAIPELGGLYFVRRRELAGVRTWRPAKFKKYVIFYRPVDNGIEILHITHGGRDLDRFLGNDS